MDYGTAHEEDEHEAWVYTLPKKTSRTFRYPFHERNEIWVLSRPREWYTDHALRHAEREFDRDVLRRRLPASQSDLDEFGEDRETEESASVVACNSD